MQGIRAAVDAVASGRLDPQPPLHAHASRWAGWARRLTPRATRPDGFLKALVTPDAMSARGLVDAGRASASSASAGSAATAWRRSCETGAVEVAAIADPSPEMARRRGRLAPGREAGPHLDELLEQELDGVVIATPSALHAEQAHPPRWSAARRCSARSRSARDAAEARARGRRGARRGPPAGRRPLVPLHRGDAARPRAGPRRRARAMSSPPTSSSTTPTGRTRPGSTTGRSSGGGCVMDLGIHLVDLALWLLDYPGGLGVSGSCSRRRAASGAPRVEDYARRAARACDGRRRPARVLVAPARGLRRRDLEPRSTAPRAGPHCERRWLVLRLRRGAYRGTAREPLAAPPDDWGGRAAVDWAARLAAGERFDSAAERLVDVARCWTGFTEDKIDLCLRQPARQLPYANGRA